MLPHIRIGAASVVLLAALGCGRDAPRAPARAIAAPPSAAPRRVLSLDPAGTEIVLALGAGDRLVGRTAYDTDPRLANLPSLGETLHPSTEALLALRPDLLIASGSREHGGATGDAARAVGMRVHTAPVETVAQVLGNVRAIAALLGLPARGDSLARSISARLDSVRARHAGRPRPSVLYVVWHEPLRTIGPGSYVDELVTAAGGCNAFPDALERWPEVSLEEVVRRDPDVIVVARNRGGLYATRRQLSRTPGWAELTAVREGRIVYVDADLFHRPGPRMAEAAATLARLLEPTIERAAARGDTIVRCPSSGAASR